MSEQQTLALNHPVNPDSVQPGQLLAFTYYGVVESVTGSIIRLNGTNLTPGLGLYEVAGEDLIRSAQSADFFAEERKVCRTKIAEALVASAGKPFTAVFCKQNGECRTLRGKLLAHEAMFGRSLVIDMDVRRQDPVEDGIRLVDHRTLQSLICDGIKYVANP